ncbi:MAG: hypothetical protein CSA83_01385, partial [Actinomycetales bacterium]
NKSKAAGDSLSLTLTCAVVASTSTTGLSSDVTTVNYASLAVGFLNIFDEKEDAGRYQAVKRC